MGRKQRQEERHFDDVEGSGDEDNAAASACARSNVATHRHLMCSKGTSTISEEWREGGRLLVESQSCFFLGERAGGLRKKDAAMACCQNCRVILR